VSDLYSRWPISFSRPLMRFWVVSKDRACARSLSNGRRDSINGM
jgi:hypothetical protein